MVNGTEDLNQRACSPCSTGELYVQDTVNGNHQSSVILIEQREMYQAALRPKQQPGLQKLHSQVYSFFFVKLHVGSRGPALCVPKVMLADGSVPPPTHTAEHKHPLSLRQVVSEDCSAELDTPLRPLYTQQSNSVT